jgi:hypothetical protein
VAEYMYTPNSIGRSMCPAILKRKGSSGVLKIAVK